MTVLIIVLGVIVLGILAILGLLLFKLIALVDKVNKRLLLITTQSLEKAQIAMAELNDALDELNVENKTPPLPDLSSMGEDSAAGFDPHTYEPIEE